MLCRFEVPSGSRDLLFQRSPLGVAQSVWLSQLSSLIRILANSIGSP